jgi:hypothetical protein
VTTGGAGQGGGGAGDGNGDEYPARPPGTWPPAAEPAVPTGAPDAYDPSYVPPPADPGHDNTHAAEGPPAALYPDGGPPPTTEPVAGAASLGEAVAAELPTPTAPAVVDIDDAPLLPAELARDGALQAAVGAPTPGARRRARTQPLRDDDDRDDTDDPGTPKRSRRTMVVASLSIVVGLGTAALVFLGRANSQRYLISCDASRAIAEQGRSFPPWGSHPLHGPEWAPITLPANAECQVRETEDVGELGKWYLDLLVDRATTTLTARNLLDSVAGTNGQPAANPLDAVAAQLDQALLLARDPDRRDQRKEITRLQGDVEYWRAASRLRDASAVLLDAAKQFEAANQQHPRHATDAAAWATFLHHLADELHAGPNGAPITASPAGPSGPPAAAASSVPVGTALPVEPDTSSGGSAAPPAPPDAGVPSGGVLL